jgi:hypothetical protein
MDETEQAAWRQEVRRLEQEIRKCDDGGLRARWASGKQMLKLRVGDRLPNGALNRAAKILKVHRSELTSRMKFAEKYPTEKQFTTVSSKSWFEIRQKALTDTPKAKKKEKTRGKLLQCALRDADALSLFASPLPAEDQFGLRLVAGVIVYLMTDSERILCAHQAIASLSGGPLTEKDDEVLRQTTDLIENRTPDREDIKREWEHIEGGAMSAEL